MAKKNLLFGITALLLLIIAGSAAAAAAGKANQNISQSLESETSTEESLTETEFPPETQLQTEPETEFIDAPSYPAVPLNADEISPEEAVLTVEAEYADYSDSLYLDTSRDGYSEKGYISGFSKSETDSITAAFMIPASQHYDITLCVCADSPVTNSLLANGEKIGDFTINETQHFVRVTFSGIYLQAGQTDLSIAQTDGNFSIDYFEISNNTELYQIKYRNSYDLSDAQASANTQKLMNYLSQQYGKNLLTGQYTASEKNTELDEIYQITGKYPAVRFGDVQNPDVIAASQRWAGQGGIVGLMWNWNAPETNSIYADETDFSLLDALPSYHGQDTQTDVNYQIDVALLTDDQINEGLANHTISASCAAILRDIDSISEALKPLAEQDIPVLWRPLHEAGGGWFWWGADGAQAYRWLWDVMYQRMTEYHNLHNLIWIWNGQSESYLVDHYDIASMDIYLSPEQSFDSRYEQFVSLYRMTKRKKILALSECSTVPDMNRMFREHTIWSFMGLWYDDYLKEPYTSEEDLIQFYNSENALTLDNVRNLLK